MSTVHVLLAALLSSSLLSPPDLDRYLGAQQPKQAANAPAWRPEKASEVLLMVKGFYDGTNDLEAKFEHHYTNPTYGERHKSKGKLAAKKPGSMVWDQAGKADPDFYTDGNTLWMVEHDTRQVIKTKVDGKSEVDAAVKLLFQGEKLLREFHVKYAKPEREERYGDADHYVLRLWPKQQSSRYQSLTLVIHATTGRVDGLVVYNTDRSTSYYEFSRIKTNVGLPDDRFVYERPRNYVESVE